MVEVNLKRTFSSGEWEKGVAIKDNVIIVEKVGIWPMCALLNIKVLLLHFILAVKIPFKRGGMKKVNKNIFLFVVPVARVLANVNRTITTVTKRYLSQK